MNQLKSILTTRMQETRRNLCFQFSRNSEMGGGKQLKDFLHDALSFFFQIVAAEGVNSTGEKLVVNKICTVSEK